MTTLLEQLPDGGEPFDPYFVPDDWARLQYGRLLWRNPRLQSRLLHHWTDPRHPWRERFTGRTRDSVEKLLESDPSEEERLDRQFRETGQSLRTVMREIPPVFGDFY